MVATKIVNEQEAVRWIEEGKTYKWIVEEYKRKYGIDTAPSLWGNLRRKHGIDPRIVRNDDLLPWEIKEEHRWLFPPQMLRAEARRRAGKSIGPEDDKVRLENFLKRLKDDNLVVHYDPDTPEGFFYVPAREGIDTDLVRVPQRKTTKRRRAD
ncbi:hypothetical protein [Micromonospora sp. CB01531]|uniref:hypothetical protein n=1 Tax=Micromonospora sp. CB01531 TaxID=1718947 RepID=UPI00093D7260|nr:hypothetical protein [Micromonospora sp. CB01531]OKI45121.1 hypothetical protein A6A27_11955 [Micromonospora sp. CB01531]